MKTRWMVTLLLIATLSIMAGCKKKEPVTPPVEPAGQEAPGMMDDMQKAAGEAVQKTTDAAKGAVEAVKEAFTTDINLEKPLSDLKAEAAKMDMETLKAVAVKYKDAIMEKQAALKPLTDKLAAIPVTEKLGAEAKTLTEKIKTLADAIAPLKERFGVYVDTLKAKGGDVSNLTL